MYAAAELLFYATLLYLCVCFKYDAVAPLAVGSREEEEGGGCNPLHFLQRENATFIRASSCRTSSRVPGQTVGCCSVRTLEAELKYGAGAARLEKAVGTFGKSFIQILHPCHLNPSYGEPFCSFNYTEQLSECAREGFCPSLMAPIRAKESRGEREKARLRTALEIGLNKPYLAKAEPLACLLCKLIAGSVVLCVVQVFIN